MTIIPRKAHVKRIAHDSFQWVDIMRLDEFEVSTSAGAQRAIVNVKWRDEDSEEANGREYDVVPVVLQSGVTIDVNAIKKMIISNSGQRQTWRFKNDPSNEKRTVKKKRIYGVAGVPDATTPVDWDTYRAALISGGVGSAIGQYVDVEFVDTFDRGNSGQRDTTHLKNGDLESLFLDAPVGVDAIRLDPLQTIINMQAAPESITGIAQFLWDDDRDGETGNPASPNTFTIGQFYENAWVHSYRVLCYQISNPFHSYDVSLSDIVTVGDKLWLDTYAPAVSAITLGPSTTLPPGNSQNPYMTGDFVINFPSWSFPVSSPYDDINTYLSKFTHVTNTTPSLAATMSLDLGGVIPSESAYGTTYTPRYLIPDSSIGGGFLASAQIIYRRIDLP